MPVSACSGWLVRRICTASSLMSVRSRCFRSILTKVRTPTEGQTSYQTQRGVLYLDRERLSQMNASNGIDQKLGSREVHTVSCVFDA